MTVIGFDTVHEFTLDEMLTLCDALALQSMPAVLRIEARDEDTSPAADLESARKNLVREGELDELGNVDLDVRGALEAAIAPDWMIEMRRVDATQILRVCLVGVADRRFMLTRNGEQFTTRELRAHDDAALVQNEIGRLIGEAPGATVREIRQPSDVLDSALAACADPDDYAAAFFRLGLDETDARILSQALWSCSGQTEIVAHAASETERTVIAVFDTHRGRIVSVATPSVTGERWTSIAPGDRNRVAAALRQLAHTLPGGV